MAGRLEGKRIAFLATDGVEQVELTEPWKAVEQEGGTPELVSIKNGEIQGMNHMDKGDTFKVDTTAGEADASSYAGLVLPGGVANPDFLRSRRERRRGSCTTSSSSRSRSRRSATARGRWSRPTSCAAGR